MATHTQVIYRKNPLFGQPGEPEMLPPETVEVEGPDPLPASLSATAFQDHCYANLGGGTAGMARFKQIIRQARALASDPNTPNDLVGACVERYDTAKSGGTFAKSEVASFSAILVGATLMLPAERSAILDNWPTG